MQKDLCTEQIQRRKETGTDFTDAKTEWVREREKRERVTKRKHEIEIEKKEKKERGGRYRGGERDSRKYRGTERQR